MTFSSELSKWQQKKFFFGLLLTSFFKDKKSLKSHKTVEIKNFHNFVCLLMKGSGARSVLKITDPDPGRPKHKDPTDLAPAKRI